ncbi:MAG: hypothetical protein J5642_02600 [Bacteroidales bacterium]|nr:hypothetical protein [Bacteroidales bacterium]
MGNLKTKLNRGGTSPDNIASVKATSGRGGNLADNSNIHQLPTISNSGIKLPVMTAALTTDAKENLKAATVTDESAALNPEGMKTWVKYGLIAAGVIAGAFIIFKIAKK